MRSFILGTDWWDDCDDAVALRLLLRAHKAGDARLLGVCINACEENSVRSLDGFMQKHGISDIPIALDRDATDFGRPAPYQKRLATYAPPGVNNDTAEEPVTFYKRLLAQSTEPVEIIEIGFLQVLAALLQDGEGYDLVRRKVSGFWVMAGRWDIDGGVENNFSKNARARDGAAYFCQNCPVPTTFLGFEVGEAVISGRNLPEEDVLGRVLADWGTTGRPSWDPMTVLLALMGDTEKAGYTTVAGTARVDADTGANHFIADKNGLHRYVVKAKPDDWYAVEIDRRIL